jgi:hypothetical protein
MASKKKLMIGVYHIRHEYIKEYKLERALLGRCPLASGHCPLEEVNPCLRWSNPIQICAELFLYRYIVRPDRERG